MRRRARVRRGPNKRTFTDSGSLIGSSLVSDTFVVVNSVSCRRPGAGRGKEHRFSARRRSGFGAVSASFRHFRGRTRHIRKSLTKVSRFLGTFSTSAQKNEQFPSRACNRLNENSFSEHPDSGLFRTVRLRGGTSENRARGRQAFVKIGGRCADCFGGDRRILLRLSRPRDACSDRSGGRKRLSSRRACRKGRLDIHPLSSGCGCSAIPTAIRVYARRPQITAVGTEIYCRKRRQAESASADRRVTGNWESFVFRACRENTRSLAYRPVGRRRA